MTKRNKIPDWEKPDFDDNPEWTEEDFKKAKRLHEIPELAAHFKKVRGPQKAPKKVQVTIRLSPDVLDHFKAGGAGWQARIDDTLKKAVAG